MSIFFQNIYGALYQISPQEIETAESYFPTEYIEKLRHKSTYNSSIVSRYIISKLVAEKFGVPDFLPRIDTSGKPIFESDIFWSIAHSGNSVFVCVTKGIPIGVDVEEILPRDPSLLETFTEQEWDKFDTKNWENFYTLWTAKEAVIKLKRGNLDDMTHYPLQSISQTQTKIG